MEKCLCNLLINKYIKEYITPVKCFFKSLNFKEVMDMAENKSGSKITTTKKPPIRGSFHYIYKTFVEVGL